MTDLLVQVFAFVQWPRFAHAPVNMWNAAKTGAPDVRTEAIDRRSFHAEVWSLIARIPSLVISGRFRPAALRQH
jgi:hypothetical protein